MDAIGDVRALALPCVFVGSLLQYLRFAKKPMSWPCHRVTDRSARRFVLIGLVIELLSLRLLPLIAAYPMNASALVLMYFWKESKRSVSSSCLPCLAALSAWVLPWLDPEGSSTPKLLEAGPVLDALFNTNASIFVISLLSGSSVLFLMGTCCGEGPFLSCAPPALNFGVSAMLLKAFVQVCTALVTSPTRPDLWVLAPSLLLLIFGVRSAAASPLRRAMEVHDTLSVLTNYGAVSSFAAMMTGGLIYGEISAWDFNRQAIFIGVGCLHCWGVRSLGHSGAVRGGSSKKDEVEDQSQVPEKPTRRGGGGSFTNGAREDLQLVDMSKRGVVGHQEDKLLNFDAPPTVEENAELEEQLFARALAPQRVAPAAWDPTANGLSGPAGRDDHAIPPDPWGATQGWGAFGDPAVLPVGEPETPQFDADFEEIMRRFDEDDKQNVDQEAGPGVIPIVELSSQVLFDSSPEPKSSPVEPAVAKAGIPAPVLEFDAGTLLDDTVGVDDEDELLKNIIDIP